jgi:hypothetical protein
MMVRGLVLSCALLATTACGILTGPSVPDRAPDMVGVVTERSPDGVLVTPEQPDQCGIRYWGLGEADIFVREDGRIRETGPEELVVGAEVAAWGRGPIQESCPMGQALEAIEIRSP